MQETENQSNEIQEEQSNLLESTPEAQTPQEPSSPSIDQEKLNRYMEQLKMEQNLPMGIIAGAVAALVGAILWAVITVGTGYQIGYMAIAVGLIVGFAIRFAGKGMDNVFGIAGAILALLGCVLGNFLSIVGYLASELGIGFFEAFSLIDFGLIPDVMMETFSIIDLLFYGLAIYAGYKFSFRRVSDEDLMDNASA